MEKFYIFIFNTELFSETANGGVLWKKMFLEIPMDGCFYFLFLSDMDTYVASLFGITKAQRSLLFSE